MWKRAPSSDQCHVSPGVVVHETVGLKHLEHMWELHKDLADGACFREVLSRNLEGRRARKYVHY